MESFIIKKIRISGVGKIDGVVEFKDGLNLILGRSNTGKTWILKSIYYLFGSDKNPFSKLTGYSDIEGIFTTKEFGDIIIRRKLNEKYAKVSCTNSKVKDGYYYTSYQGKGPLYLNDLWLRIIGVKETIEVPKNSRYERVRISWTNIVSVFFADEDEIDKSESLITKERTTETAVISSLYYLLTGDYKKDIPEILKPEIRKANQKAISNYIDDEEKVLSDKRSICISELEKLNSVDVDKQIKELSKKISELQNKLSELVNENSMIINKISYLQKENASCILLIDRYKSLESQYKSDLQRLTFIVKGEESVKKISHNDICPLCGNYIDNEYESYTDAIQGETKRIVSELAIILETESNVREEQVEIDKKIDELENRRKEITKDIENYNFEINNFRIDLKRYVNYTKLQSNIDFIDEQLRIIGEKRELESKKKESSPLYQPKKEFEQLVEKDFEIILNRILKECNYNIAYASWDFKNFDILMNEVAKGEEQGKGYRSFLNSVIALMLYEYFNSDKSFIKPGILMIDTPLLGFDENKNDISEKSLKNGLYQYFINHKGNGQIIIVDNLNMVPDIDLEATGANVIIYHKDEINGNVYGLLPSWRKDLPNN